MSKLVSSGGADFCTDRGFAVCPRFQAAGCGFKFTTQTWVASVFFYLTLWLKLQICDNGFYDPVGKDKCRFFLTNPMKYLAY